MTMSMFIWIFNIQYNLLKITVDAGKISYDCNQLLAILPWLGDGGIHYLQGNFIVCQYNITYFTILKC